MQIRQDFTKLMFSLEKMFCARAILRVSRNASSGNFEFFSMGASHFEDIFKLNATKFT